MKAIHRVRSVGVCLIVLATLPMMTGACSNSTAEGKSGVSLAGFFGGPRVTVPSGTQIKIRLAQSVSSQTARPGDSWQGVLTSPVTVDDRVVIPAGAQVEGVVVAVKEAERGSRARLELGVRAVTVDERRTSLRASSEPVIAGSTRARNLGAIAGGAAAGALIGEATSGDAGKGAIIGGVLATGAVAASKGYQVVLGNGTVMTFTVSDNVSMKVD